MICLLWSSVGPLTGDTGLPVCPFGLVLPRAWVARLDCSSLWASSALAITWSALLTVPLSCLVRVDSWDLFPLLFFFFFCVFLGAVLPKKTGGAGPPAIHLPPRVQPQEAVSAVPPAGDQARGHPLPLSPGYQTRSSATMQEGARPTKHAQRHPNCFASGTLIPKGLHDVAWFDMLYN